GVDRVHDPDPDPRLPSLRTPRRADARGRLMSNIDTHVGVEGEVLQEGGYNSRLRRWWQGLPEERRRPILIGIQTAVVVLLWFVDHSLGYGAAVFCAFLWMPKLAPIPWRLGVQAVMVLAFLIAAAVGPMGFAVPILLAIASGFFWIPERQRRWALPTV